MLSAKFFPQDRRAMFLFLSENMMFEDLVAYDDHGGGEDPGEGQTQPLITVVGATRCNICISHQ
jgi:hypothetical protein